jgi:two-component system NarL family sensor kinase
MTLPLRLLYVAVLQVVLTSFITYFLITDEYRELSEKNVTILETFLIEQKKQALKNYTSIALTSVNQAYDSPIKNDSKTAQEVVADTFTGLVYNGDDGYFFIYDEHGNSIVHPKEPYRVGKNWWQLEDSNGEKIIQHLISNAQNGGDFYRYNWLKPSESKKVQKISYSIYMDKWNWMLGTGVYLDDVYQQLSNLQAQMDTHINYTKRIILIVAMSSIFFIFLFGILVNLSHKKKAEAKISELSQRVIDVQEEESRHISRELHDGIIQILISVKYSLEATGLYLTKSKQDKPSTLALAEENLSIAIQEVRRISHHMHPQILDELGLSEAIESIANDFSKRTNVPVQVNKPALRKLLPDFINTTLFRIVQEALTNIQKHAKAESVLIALSVENNWLTLIIKDDGIGFDNEMTNNKGIGLRNLAERVEHHQGKFAIKSSKMGTTVTVKIPTVSFANHFNESTLGSGKNELTN